MSAQSGSVISRRDFLARIAAAVAGAAASARAAAAGPSLKEACKDLFLIGTALDFRTPNEFTAEELELIKTHFNVITPENSMKPGPVHPQENSWNWISKQE